MHEPVWKGIADTLTGYRAAFAGALAAYLAGEATQASTQNKLKAAVTTFLLLAFLDGYKQSSGGQSPAGEDVLWINARIAAEIGFTAGLLSSLADIDTEGKTPAEIEAMAEAAAAGYMATLLAVYNEGLLRGNRDVMLTFTGADGRESCRTCQRLKGERRPASWWISHRLIPGQPGNAAYECKGYHCEHYLIEDDGHVYTRSLGDLAGSLNEEAHMPGKMVLKTFDVTVVEKTANGGRIIINTASLDRQRDRVLPGGGQFANYYKNPVVQWGHNYRDPFATIGRTITLTQSPNGLEAEFELRPPANDQDPQHIVKLLWDGGWIRTASIGFIPLTGRENAEGGQDFTTWELLEWSLVPIPANAEALRLAYKSLADGDEQLAQPAGDVTPEAAAQPVQPVQPEGRAWLRRATIAGNGEQKYLVAFYRRTVDVPQDAELLQMDMVLGECASVPHPDAGKTVTFKDALFIPPLELSRQYDYDLVHRIEQRDCADADLITNDAWSVVELSDVIEMLSIEKAMTVLHHDQVSPLDIVTERGLAKAAEFARRAHRAGDAAAKSGRVLSRKNEKKIKDARDNLDEVLAEVEQQPEQDGADDVLHMTLTNDLLKSAIPPHTTPMADPDTAWDGGAVMRECPNERAKLRLICAWVDSAGDPDAKSSYKFSHHLVDGRVVLRGVNNAKARLPQAEIPEADRAGVEKHLDRHQAQFEKAVALRDYARALTEAADDLDGHQHLSDEDERALVSELRTLLITIQGGLR